MNSSDFTRPHLSRLGLGTGTLGTFGKSASVNQVSGLLDTMTEHSITVIDTADSYGSGQAEILLGRAMRGRRDRFFVMTKAGYRHGSMPWPLSIINPFVKKALQRAGRRQCFDPDYLEKCLVRSLKRLGTNHMDVFFLHDPSLEDLERLDGLARIKHLRASGMADELGVSSGDPNVVRAALATGLVGFIQTPANLLDAAGLIDCWDACARQGLPVVGNHVMGPGNLGFRGLTREMMMRSAAALLPAKSVILCGTRNPSHLVESASWVAKPLENDKALQLMESARNAQHTP